LIDCQYRTSKVLFQRLDNPDSAKTAASNEHRIGAFRNMCPDPFVKRTRLYRLLIRR
jgi:hypothetical protein